MDVVVQGLMQKFQGDRCLLHLAPEQLFETFAAYCVLGQFYEDDFDPDNVRIGSSRDLSMDAVAVVINGTLYTEADDVEQYVSKSRDLRVHFVVVQAKLEDSFKSGVFAQLAADLHAVFGPSPLAFAASARVKNFRRCVEAIYADKTKLGSERPRLSVWYATYGKIDPGVLEPRQTAAESYMRTLNRFGRIHFRPIGAEGLQELYKRESEAVSVTVAMPHASELPPMPGITRSFIGAVPAKELVDKVLTDPVGNIRESLFHDNVRAFLGYGADSSGNRVGVNAEIRATIRDDGVRGDFAVLNNGITIVARKLDTYDDTFTLNDFQIVNGCQTCYVLFDEQDRLSDDIHVNVRIIGSADESLISRIVAATNRQNNMTRDDLSVQDQIHKKIEGFFRAQADARKLYYERRPKQYVSEKIEKTRILSRQQLTKAYAAMFLDEAHRVTRLTEVVASHQDDLFRESHEPLEYYAAATTYYRIEWLIRNQRLASIYSPARYHLIALVKAYLLGPNKLPSGVRLRKAACEKILDVMWDAEKATALVKQLIPPLLDAASEVALDEALSDVVKKSQFRLNALKGALGLPGAALH